VCSGRALGCLSSAKICWPGGGSGLVCYVSLRVRSTDPCCFSGRASFGEWACAAGFLDTPVSVLGVCFVVDVWVGRCFFVWCGLSVLGWVPGLCFSSCRPWWCLVIIYIVGAGRLSGVVVLFWCSRRVLSAFFSLVHGLTGAWVRLRV